MILKTRGIVLGQIPFKESSLIIKIYTEELGTRGIIQRAAKSNSKKSKSAYFLPLSLLDLVIYHKPERDLDSISEVKFFKAYQSIPFQTVRTSIAIFLSEVLSQALRHEPGNTQKFDFISKALLEFDEPDFPFKDFPGQFLFKLTHYLGFGPQSIEDLQEGIDQSSDPKLFNSLIRDMLKENEYPSFSSGNERLGFIKIILNFYQKHIENFRDIKSLYILHEVLA